jgi:hypothetical protein
MTSFVTRAEAILRRERRMSQTQGRKAQGFLIDPDAIFQPYPRRRFHPRPRTMDATFDEDEPGRLAFLDAPALLPLRLLDRMLPAQGEDAHRQEDRRSQHAKA